MSEVALNLVSKKSLRRIFQVAWTALRVFQGGERVTPLREVLWQGDWWGKKFGCSGDVGQCLGSKVEE